jgi:hypothetical protein
MRLFLGYGHQERQSNIRTCADDPIPNGVCEGRIISPVDYASDRLIVRLEAGWL